MQTKSRKYIVRSLIAVAAALWIPQTSFGTGSPLLDGGFESASTNIFDGSLGDGWFVTQGNIQIMASGAFLGSVAHSGNQFAALDNGFTVNTLAQTITTIPNQVYTLSYWVADTSPNPLTVMFDGTVLFDGNSPSQGVTSPGDYVQYQYLVTSTSSSTLLSFTGQYTSAGNSVGTILDDVSLTIVPEPSFPAFLELGLLVVVGRRIFFRSSGRE